MLHNSTMTNLSNFFLPKPILVTEFFFDYIDYCLLQILIYNFKDFFNFCNISVPCILIFVFEKVDLI